jgi:thioredoxin-related protein
MKNSKTLINIIFFIFLSTNLLAQGVRFEQNISWHQVLEKAKIENKIIFIDAFTTWCGPCKMMDKTTYLNEEVGAAMQSKFIAIKVQMDRTALDNQDIKNWYADADFLKSKFKVDAFPSLIFLSPNGELLNKETGYRDDSAFLQLTKSASNPTESFSRLVNLFRQGKISVPDQELLALRAKNYNETEIANQVATSYLNNYLKKENPSLALVQNNKDFITEFAHLFNLTDPIAQYIYKNGKRIDSIAQNSGLSQRFTEYLINKKYFDIEKLTRTKGVKWKKIEAEISRNFGKETAQRLTVMNKIQFYKQLKDWENVVKYSIEQKDIEKETDTSAIGRARINNLVYEVIFTYTNNKEYLKKGIDYMQMVINAKDVRHEQLDTYANILYKMGSTDIAIEQEQKAIQLARTQNDLENIPLYIQTIEKMKANEPTWKIIAKTIINPNI